MLGFAGVRAIDVKVAGVTVSVVDPLTEPSWAVMVVEPVLEVEARPVAEMVATVVLEEVQVTVAVRFCVVPSV